MDTTLAITLLAGTKPADSTKMASAVAFSTPKGMRLIRFFRYTSAEEKEVVESGMDYASKEDAFQLRPTGAATFVFRLLLTKGTNGKHHLHITKESVSGDVLDLNDDGDFPPVIYTSAEWHKSINEWAGYEVATIIPGTLEERTGAVKSEAFKKAKAEAEAAVKPKPKPLSILRDLNVASFIVLQEQGRELSARRAFAQIGKASRRCGGAWSEARMSKKEKKNLDAWLDSKYSFVSSQ